MGVTLYKPGDIHTVRGIPCDLKVFDSQTFKSNLNVGWHLTPEECYAKEEEPEEKEIYEEAEAEEALNLNQMSDNEIRALAKEKGIPRHYNKGIVRLKTELEEWQQEI